jgi:hypothetical protein
VADGSGADSGDPGCLSDTEDGRCRVAGVAAESDDEVVQVDDDVAGLGMLAYVRGLAGARRAGDDGQHRSPLILEAATATDSDCQPDEAGVPGWDEGVEQLLAKLPALVGQQPGAGVTVNDARVIQYLADRRSAADGAAAAWNDLMVPFIARVVTDITEHLGAGRDDDAGRAVDVVATAARDEWWRLTEAWRAR